MEWGSGMLLDGGGLLNQPPPSRFLRITVKNRKIFDIPKFYNELKWGTKEDGSLMRQLETKQNKAGVFFLSPLYNE